MDVWTDLNLYNFVESKSANKSKYVLTSPRSLEACSILQIQPVDLLPMSLEEFSEGLLLNSKDAERLYKKFEIDRLRKLNLCREERKKLIEKELTDFEQKPDIQDHSTIFNVVTSRDASRYNTPRKLESASILSEKSAFNMLPGSDSEDENDPNDLKESKHDIGLLSLHKIYPERSVALPAKSSVDTFIEEFQNASQKNGDTQYRKKWENSLLCLEVLNLKDDLKKDNTNDDIRTLNANWKVLDKMDKKRREDCAREEEHQKLQRKLKIKNDIAQDSFSRNMKEKQMKLIMQKLKEEERKLYRQRQLSLMDKDLKRWQDELVLFQTINESRAREIVEKKNESKKQKVLNNRLIKELDHAALKIRIEQENKLREEETKTAILLKEKRVELINKEKDEFLKVSRDVARANRVLRDLKKEKDMHSSFDKMAANAEKIARIEKLSLRKTTPTSIEKHKSNIVLG
ncbi:DNA ligase 1-like isoform X2 [Hydra vulgaris]